MTRQHWSVSRPRTNNYHWINAEQSCQLSSSDMFSESSDTKTTTTGGQKPKPYSMLEHQHLEFLPCISSYYNHDYSRQRSTFSRNPVKTTGWISPPLSTFGEEVLSNTEAQSEIRLHCAWLLGFVPTSLWK